MAGVSRPRHRRQPALVERIEHRQHVESDATSLQLGAIPSSV